MFLFDINEIKSYKLRQLKRGKYFLKIIFLYLIDFDESICIIFMNIMDFENDFDDLNLNKFLSKS